MSAPSENFRAHSHRAAAVIHLEALRHNARVARDLGAGDASSLMAVVKADAYGHGLPKIVNALRGMDRVGRFGVANLEEAVAVREADPDTPVVILGTALPEEREPLVSSGFEACLSSLEEAHAFQALAAASGTKLKVHAVVDTGMGRMGFLEKDAVESILNLVNQCPNLHLVGLESHFPSADEDAAYTRDQAGRFLQLVERLEKQGVKPELIHIDNSAGLIVHAGPNRCTLARAGLMLYGISPIPEFQERLQPVLSLHSKVTLVRRLPAGHGISYGRTFSTDRPTTVATIAIGYGDGYPRHLSGTGCEVLIRGTRCPLLGRITMDQIMADVSALKDRAPGEGTTPGVQPGDDVVLIGRQGSEIILATELANRAGTIPWEIFTGITRRVPRIYPGPELSPTPPENSLETTVDKG